VFTYNNGGIFFSGGGLYTSGIFQNVAGLNLQTGTIPRITISSTGNVGIGTISPNYPLHVYKSGSISTINVESSTGQNAQFRLEEAGTVKSAITWVPADSSTRFYSNGSDRLTIATGGQVLIGTSTLGSATGTTDLLTIGKSGSSSTGINFTDGTSNRWGFIYISNAKTVYGSFTDTTFETGASATERMRVASSGKVSISAPTTTDAFTVQGANNYWTSILTSGTTTSQAYGLYVKAGTNASDVPFLIQNTSGTDLLRMLGTGVVTLPSQPSFYATSTAGETAYTSGQVIVFNTTRHNIGSHYNTSTGRFTAPVAGKYLFTLNIYCYGGYNSAILLTVNGSQYTVSDVTPYIAASASSFSTTLGFTLVWELAAGDYVEVRARSGNSAQIYRAHSHFSGQLLS